MKKNSLFSLLLALSLWLPVSLFGQAKVQFIHNSPDVTLDSVDIYINKSLVLDNFKFRYASEFINGPSGIPLLIDICAPNSTNPDNPLFSLPVQLASGKKYLAIASGTLDGNGYNPYEPFEIKMIDYARETSVNTGKTDILFFHGSPDAPVIDLWETTTSQLLADNLGYGDTEGYAELDPLNYIVEVKDSATQEILYSLQFDLTGYSGQAGVVYASGFLDPASNNNGMDLTFYFASAVGGPSIPLPLVPDPVAFVQVIHNSADAALSLCDIWVNDKKLASSIAFRTAIPFTEIDAGVSTTVSVLPAGSTSPSNPLASLTHTFNNLENYLLIINGIQSSTGYTPNPPLTLVKKDNARVIANTGQTDLTIFHGSTDAPTVDIYETGVGLGLLSDNLSYGNFNTGGYLSVTTADYVIEVRDESGATVLKSYYAPFSALGFQGKAITLLASGFLNPSNNSNGPAFGLYVAKSEGGQLFELPAYTPPSSAWLQLLHNSADAAATSVKVWINNDVVVDNFTYKRATPYLEVTAGQNITLALTPVGATSPEPALASLVLNLEAGKRNIASIDGITSTTGYDPPKPLTISLIENTRLVALNSGNVDVIFHNGSTDAPVFNLYEFTTGELFSNLAYGVSSPYVEIPAADIGIHMLSGGVITKSYLAPLLSQGYSGQAALAVICGFLNPGNNSSGDPMGMYLVPAAGGGYIPMEEVTGTPETEKPAFRVYPNPAHNTLNIVAGQDAMVTIFDLTGHKKMEWNLSLSEFPFQADVSTLPAGMYLVRASEKDRVQTYKIHILP